MVRFFQTRWPWLVISSVVLLSLALYASRRGTAQLPAPAQQVANASLTTQDTAITTSATNDTLIATDVLSPEVFGSRLFYASGTGLFSIDLNTTRAKPTQVATLPRTADEVRWLPDGKRALALVSTNPVTWQSVNLETKTSSELTNTFVGPALASQRDRIIYTYEGSAGTNVSIADLDGANWQMIMTPPNEIVRWWWPGDGTVAIGADERADPPQYVRLFVGQKRIETITTSYGYDLRVKLSPDETRSLIDTGTLDAPTIIARRKRKHPLNPLLRKRELEGFGRF